MATIAVGGVLIGIDLALNALAGLGIALIGGLIFGNIKEAIEKHENEVREYIQDLDISSNISDHVLHDKHDFSDECGESCIMYVAYTVKNSISWYNNGYVPYIRGSDNCRHGCDIEVRMSVPKGKKEWVIGTAFHKGPCLAEYI